MKKLSIAISLLVLSSHALFSQCNIFSDSVVVQTKIWSRDSLRNIIYSDWKSFTTHTVSQLKKFKPKGDKNLDKYGGDQKIKLASTGFFHTKKIDNRCYIIDPEGSPFISTGITSLRRGSSPDNNKAYLQKFGEPTRWMSATARLLQESGFNTAGSWSDTEQIILYNKTATYPLAYTTQLNLLAGYINEAKKKNPDRNNLPAIFFITDKDFIGYCEQKAKQISTLKDDPNLLGHFSDNEIAFIRSALTTLSKGIAEKDQNYLPAASWLKEKGYDYTNLTNDQSDELIGWLAGIYFRTVSSAIKKYDPNHLFIGSRLHSTAKHNKHLFFEAEPYIDIISINYYGNWEPQKKHIDDWATWSNKPFFITEFYTKGEDSKMGNISGAGWLVKTQTDRGIHYQNFCMQLLMAKNCVGWHWFRYQDNDPNDPSADPSNNDSNKGIVNTKFEAYQQLTEAMKYLNNNKYRLIKYFEKMNCK